MIRRYISLSSSHYTFVYFFYMQNINVLVKWAMIIIFLIFHILHVNNKWQCEMMQ